MGNAYPSRGDKRREISPIKGEEIVRIGLWQPEIEKGCSKWR
jgi:hypothetical protein